VKLARLGPVGHEIPVVLDGIGARDLRELTPDIDGAFLAGRGIERVRASWESLPELPGASSMRIGAPIGRPSAVYCIGMNYAAHAAESGSEPPEQLVMFMKSPNTVVGPNDDVTIPRSSTKTDWEVELGVVIGARAGYLDTASDADAVIAGYLIANDLSEREWQLETSGGQWSKGKSAPSFCPTGPWLVTPDEVDASDLRLRSFVNGEPRQDSSTADLIFGVQQIIWTLSQVLVLEPGDLILTGTPQGVALSGRFPYLTVGDVVDLDIEGLGAQRQRYV
jgi:2-keto-4-pentenoate hydratase/2-oxohepta-3-ene-1,7-dioic acid hydratase in catechol pathway